jgi:V8-like Glu-specific endopeptidase
MAYDESVYEAQRRGVTNRYSQQNAANALGRFVNQQRGDRGIADYTQNYRRNAPGVTAAYAKRGLAGGGVQSGVYQNAMRNYVGDYNQNLNRMYADQQTELNQFDLNTAGYEADRQQAMTEIEANKTREIANAAAYLQQLRGQG